MKLKKLVTAVTAIAATAVLALTGCSASPGGGSGETIKIGTVPALYWAAWSDTAEAMAEAGSDVNVEMVPFKSSADVFVALRSGEIDMASMGMNVMAAGLAENPELPVSMVAGLSPGRSQLLVAKDSGIDSWDDLEGANLGVIRGSTDELIFNIALAKNDIDMETDTQVTTLQASADLLLAFRNGDIDAAVTYQPYTAQAVSQGIADAPEDMNAELTEWASVPTDIFATDEIIEENPEAVQAVVDAFVEKTNTFEDKDVWVETALKYQSGEEDLLLEAIENDVPWYRMEQSTHAEMAAAMAEYGTVSEDVSDVLLEKMNYDFLSEATGQSPEELGKEE